MEQLQRDLIGAIEGEVRFDAATRRAYSVDASIYEIEPLGVVTPKHRADLLKVIEIAHYHHTPLTARGAATGIAGGCIGYGLIVDLSKYFRSIIKINYEQEYAICEPGVIQDQLNAELSLKGYRLGPDTSTGNRATIGGMLANNAAGARSLRYGKMVDHVEEVTLALSDGELLTLKMLSEEELQVKSTLQSREGAIYRSILKLRAEYGHDIKEHFPRLPRRVSGYNLDELVKGEGLNLAKLVAGSEGTLGLAVDIKLKICKKPKVTALCLIHCTELLPAMRLIPAMLTHALLSLEMIDAKIIAAGRGHPTLRGKLSWLVGDPQAVYIAELEGEELLEVQEKLHAFTLEMQKLNIGYAYVELMHPAAMQAVWELRKAGLGLLLSKRTYSRAIAFIEDVSVAPTELFAFMQEFLACLKSFGKEAGIYGHVGAGCIHVRPYIDLGSADEQQLMQKMMIAVAELLLAHGGALSGEHGDGYIRSWLNEKMFGPRLYTAFCQLKAAFDPPHLLNPGKIVHPLPLLHDLRMPTEIIRPLPLATFLDFNPEGGFDLTADLCNGNGMCRKSEGVMCPSFQVTNDEYDTTRARAQALRAIIHGHWPKEALASQQLYDVLDLCVQCKGCKTECPSQVDMAKMKSEVLYHYQQTHGYPLRNRLFGHIGKLNQLLSPLARLANASSESRLGKKLFSWLGIAPQRRLPTLARERFTHWFHRQPQQKCAVNGKKVVLFSDTFTEFNYPEIGKAAVSILQALGYYVIVPSWSCCGRTLYSKGMLKQAKKNAIKLISQLTPFAEQNIPIIGLEPSCLFMLIDDLQGLVGDNLNLKKIQALGTSFDAFLHRHLVNGKLPLALKGSETFILFHGHCHQKAHEGMQVTVELLRSLPGCHVEVIDSGCCGMAGAFGYESEHYAFSMQIGCLKLFPAIRKTPSTTLLVANGISCRQQIADGTGRKALHLAELLALRQT